MYMTKTAIWPVLSSMIRKANILLTQSGIQTTHRTPNTALSSENGHTALLSKKATVYLNSISHCETETGKTGYPPLLYSFSYFSHWKNKNKEISKVTLTSMDTLSFYNFWLYRSLPFIHFSYIKALFHNVKWQKGSFCISIWVWKEMIWNHKYCP